MISTSLAFILALAITAILTPIVRDFAIRRKLAHAPRAARDMHATPIPRIGGIAIAIGFMVPLVALFVLDTGISNFIQRDPEWLSYVIALGGGSLAIVAVGLCLLLAAIYLVTGAGILNALLAGITLANVA